MKLKRMRYVSVVGVFLLVLAGCSTSSDDQPTRQSADINNSQLNTITEEGAINVGVQLAGQFGGPLVGDLAGFAAPILESIFGIGGGPSPTQLAIDQLQQQVAQIQQEMTQVLTDDSKLLEGQNQLIYGQEALGDEILTGNYENLQTQFSKLLNNTGSFYNDYDTAMRSSGGAYYTLPELAGNFQAQQDLASNVCGTTSEPYECRNAVSSLWSDSANLFGNYGSGGTSGSNSVSSPTPLPGMFTGFTQALQSYLTAQAPTPGAKGQELAGLILRNNDTAAAYGMLAAMALQEQLNILSTIQYLQYCSTTDGEVATAVDCDLNSTMQPDSPWRTIEIAPGVDGYALSNTLGDNIKALNSAFLQIQSNVQPSVNQAFYSDQSADTAPPFTPTTQIKNSAGVTSLPEISVGDNGACNFFWWGNKQGSKQRTWNGNNLQLQNCMTPKVSKWTPVSTPNVNVNNCSDKASVAASYLQDASNDYTVWYAVTCAGANTAAQWGNNAGNGWVSSMSDSYGSYFGDPPNAFVATFNQPWKFAGAENNSCVANAMVKLSSTSDPAPSNAYGSAGSNGILGTNDNCNGNSTSTWDISLQAPNGLVGNLVLGMWINRQANPTKVGVGITCRTGDPLCQNPSTGSRVCVAGLPVSLDWVSSPPARTYGKWDDSQINYNLGGLTGVLGAQIAMGDNSDNTCKNPVP